MGVMINAVRTAFEKGYRVTKDGKVLSPTGTFRKLGMSSGCSRSSGTSRPRYLTFNVVDSRKKRVPVPVHRLAGYQLYGEAALDSVTQVRHLDGDHTNNRFTNLAIGSGTDNALDRPEAERKAHARHAASFRRNLTDRQVGRLKKDRARGETYAQLSEKYGIAKSSISRIMHGTLYT
jgi:hypothetical protein